MTGVKVHWQLFPQVTEWQGTPRESRFGFISGSI